MKSAVLTAPGKIEIQDKEQLTPEAHEVVISVETTGICGTDLALFSGDYLVKLPAVCGHEFVGTVKSVGKGVDKCWVGRRVTAEINNTCIAYKRAQPCLACSRGMPGHCLERTVTGIINHSGAFSEEVKVAAGTLHKIPEALDPFTAVLTEPLAAALQTYEMTPVQGDETVVVLGSGRLGILIVFVSMIKGLKVIAISRSENKRQRALEFGAKEIVDPDHGEELVKEKTGGLGADIVIDATGSQNGLQQAQQLVRPRGVISVKTTCGKAMPVGGEFDTTKFVVDEVRLQGSRCGPFAPALDLLTRHQDKLKKLITSTRPLDETQQALESAWTEDKVILKI
ncbi:MAG: alcohol dehydrogenase catalytic domain-containing protein [Nitrospinota bacterium]|nr:alcohol dehydrogenase catalytic domain-containing protein [Nitrospinota bacterium]